MQNEGKSPQNGSLPSYYRTAGANSEDAVAGRDALGVFAI